ncbi:uncharacterized protein M437DRAFT_45046 [Aureobasidium melanogenum CBS 110374]|uniref:Uncharacterized protein n=1 Tax=Aureobasidium melanogenum (strain CBS 110374) TaxID=1043003 RepID=A0A074VVB4_AURM1|nr:uncharacterized protein M437DRAFT_45046 [Aureobasidium melanogenum CBS 110374]KEQ64418.1 hypothetical protein M437DRAFT_45046 [Aureobasidium melanogenum CBS 110374]
MSTFSWRPPSVPFEAQTRDGSPFTVWHVCIICQQPRSARYHSEHPVDPTLAVSPPQTICRRCANKSPSLPLPLLLPAPQTSPPPSSSPQIPPPQNYPAPTQDRPAPIQDYPAPVKEYSVPSGGVPLPFQDHPSTISNRSAPMQDYPLPYRERPLPLANNKPTKRRVSFSEEDEVATLPPDLPSNHDDRSMQGLSRMRLQPPNLSGKPDVHDDYVYEKQRSRTYVDPTERPYVPEPKWVPLSESPGRELPLVEESYAHGPYRAENSPTPSMQVHVDKDDFVPDKGSEPRKAPRQYLHRPVRQEDRSWTRYVTVKEYRDEKGPFVEVEEKFVFDD